jgi:DNA-binding response OmpR family regulator
MAAIAQRPVLIVEDDDSLRPVLARHLRAHGLDVEEAVSVEDAAGALEGGLRPGLVVLDLNLPGMTGWQLLRLPIFGAAGSPPVLIATGTSVNRSELAEFAVAGYLPKPFALATFTATVKRLLG